MKFRLVENFDDLLLEYKAAIEPGSELEKSLVYDIEHTDTPFQQLAKKYGISRSSVYKFAHNKNLNVSHRQRNTPSIEPNSELERAIIHDLEHTSKPYTQISKEYGISYEVVSQFAHQKNLRDNKNREVHVYFNTLKAEIQHVRTTGIVGRLEFLPSIYLGEYSVSNIRGMYEYIRDKYLKGRRPTTDRIIEFYLKIASNEIPLNTLIAEMRSQSSTVKHGHSVNFDYKFITVSKEELPTIDFNSVNYPQLAKDFLTFLNRKADNSTTFDSIYKDITDAASKLDTETADRNSQINTYIINNLDTIAHNIYSKEGTIIEATNYIDGIPYETSFDISSPQDIAECMKPYKSYLLYGFMNKTGNIVYIGISSEARSRSAFYKKENRPLILRAFKDQIIKKLIIFKSNLPIESRSVNTKLLYALEVYFAEQLFKTYPENYPKALNKAKPGKNASRLLTAQNRDKFELYISEQDKLLSAEELKSAGKEILDVGKGTFMKLYPYHKYAQDYIDKHDGNLSIEDKQLLYKSLGSRCMHVLWNICSSESEYKEIVGANNWNDSSFGNFYHWKNYRIENNLPITEDLDDDIDMEYYV